MADRDTGKHKVDKLKAHTSAMVQTGNDNLDGVITVLATRFPAAAGLLKLAQVSFGYYLVYRQEELNQFTSFLQDNPEVFLQELIETKEFRNGFTVELEHYFKLRTDAKRKVAQEIFLGFGQSTNKPEYPLERFNDTLEKISTNGLRGLAFIKNVIYPFRELELVDEVEAMHLPDPPTTVEESKEWWIDQKRSTEPLSKYINEWLENKYNFNNSDCRREFNLPNTIDEQQMENLRQMQDAKRLEVYGQVGELEQLGLAVSFVTGMGHWGGGGYEHNLNDYGVQFLEFVALDN